MINQIDRSRKRKKDKNFMQGIQSKKKKKKKSNVWKKKRAKTLKKYIYLFGEEKGENKRINKRMK